MDDAGRPTVGKHRDNVPLFVLAYLTLAHDDFAAATKVATAAGTWYGPVGRVLHGLVHVLEGRAGDAEALLAKAGPEVRHGIPTLAFALDVAEAHLFLHRGELHHARHQLEALVEGFFGRVAHRPEIGGRALTEFQLTLAVDDPGAFRRASAPLVRLVGTVVERGVAAGAFRTDIGATGITLLINSTSCPSRR